METRDLETLNHLGRALWNEDSRALSQTLETFAATSLLELSPARQVERTARGLLSRARKTDPTTMSAQGIVNPFYRLLPEERLTLSALHVARLGYARIARILSVGDDVFTEDRVGELAWGARLHLATLPGGGPLPAIPTGSLIRGGASCPDYHPGRPWTQRFLDEELNTREKAFLQAHLSGCPTCREALVRARNLYYWVGARVPGVPESALPQRVRAMSQVLSASEELRAHRGITFLSSLRVFLKRWDVWAILAAGAAIMLMR